MSVERTDVVIIGAGPFGLSLAAYLRARGVDFRIFGKAVKFWRDMPEGINLKSLGFATSIYVPERGHTFPEWCRQRNLEDFEPCTMKSFAAYGMWMQERFVPNLETEDVANVASAGREFLVTLESGRQVRAARVVCATGLAGLARCPDVMRDVPAELVPHTSELSDYSRFAGQDVAVVGAGASAIEAGALVHEAGGRAEVLVRGNRAIFLTLDPRKRTLKDRIAKPMTVLGPGLKYLVLERLPLFFHFLPEAYRHLLMRRLAGPSSPWWITDRVKGKVPIHFGTEIVAARAAGDRVRLTLRSNGIEREREVDRVILGTGYALDVARVPYLAPELKSRIHLTGGAPALSIRFESSVQGLYFIGPMAAMSFGPIHRFVCGADYTAKALARHLGGWRLPFRRRAAAPAAMPLPAAGERTG